MATIGVAASSLHICAMPAWKSSIHPPWQSLDAVVRLAGDEDVDLVGISSLSTDHLIIPDLMSRLTAADLTHVRVVVGGIVPDEEYPLLLESGVSAILGPGTDRGTIVEQISGFAAAARHERDTEFI